jgi:hypothetical protein
MYKARCSRKLCCGLVRIRTGFTVSVRIRIHFFYLSADPDLDPDPGSQTNAHPGPGQTLPSQIVGFSHEKYFYILKGWKSRVYLLLLVNFFAHGSETGSELPIRNRIQKIKIKAEPCGSGSETLTVGTIYFAPGRAELAPGNKIVNF